MIRYACAIGAVLFLLVTTAPAQGADGADDVRPGEFVVEPATLINLGFEWYIDGDENRNAEVAVSYRRVGEAEWRTGLPLLRIGGEVVARPGVFPEDFVAPAMFAGSILDLEDDTEYECRFRMSDPDGLTGQAQRTVTVRTRAEPRAFEGGRVFHVYPPGYDGPREEPAFTGLKAAYFGPGGGDWSVVAEPRVRPGDTILVHAGLYRSERHSYRDSANIPFHGTYYLSADGTPERPIAIKAAGDGEVIFDGAGAGVLFDVSAADYNYFEGLTIRNCEVAFYAGMKGILGCDGLVVKRCRLEDIGIGIQAQNEGHENFYIADNTMIGRNDPHRLLGWYDPGPYGESELKSYYGVKVYGRGHVICHNYVAYFHDGLTICTHGPPAAEIDKRPVAIDFYNNDIFLVADDFIEADGGAHNIRVMRNRGFNAGQCGLSAQPVFGGPAYFIRNIVYNVPWGVALKFKVSPAGCLVYNNTFIAEWVDEAPFSNTHLRNNLFLGTDHPDRPIIDVSTFTSYTTFDYDGYRPNRAGGVQFQWDAPPQGVRAAWSRDELTAGRFETLGRWREATGREAHGIIVDYDIFRGVTKPDPDEPTALYVPGDFDFRLVEGSAAVDAGCILPNVTDDFAGRAPDLGALESGREAPHYGPR